MIVSPITFHPSNFPAWEELHFFGFSSVIKNVGSRVVNGWLGKRIIPIGKLVLSCVPTPLKTLINKVIPTVNSYFSAAGSLLLASGVGVAYGLIGRFIYPRAGIYPLHYGIWFGLAFQIKYILTEIIGKRYRKFCELGIHHIENKKDIFAKEGIVDQACTLWWKVIYVRYKTMKAVDKVFSKVFKVRRSREITHANVKDASFLEMCRYRLWPIFKKSVVENVAFSVAYHATTFIGLALPLNTAVSTLLVIHSIAIQIIFVSAFHRYMGICRQKAMQMNQKLPDLNSFRLKMFHWFLRKQKFIRYFVPKLQIDEQEKPNPKDVLGIRRSPKPKAIANNLQMTRQRMAQRRMAMQKQQQFEVNQKAL